MEREHEGLIARRYRCTLDAVRAMPVEDYQRALAFIAAEEWADRERAKRARSDDGA